MAKKIYVKNCMCGYIFLISLQPGVSNDGVFLIRAPLRYFLGDMISKRALAS